MWDWCVHLKAPCWIKYAVTYWLNLPHISHFSFFYVLTNAAQY